MPGRRGKLVAEIFAKAGLDLREVLFRLPLSSSLPDLDALAATCMPGEAPSPMIGRRASVDSHLEALQAEFAGLPQLHFFHAGLNVLIRRGIDAELAYSHFEAIWTRKRRELLMGLSARWLVSACDTIMERATAPQERALGCAASLFLNTVKLYETERQIYGAPEIPLADLSRPAPLFDGMTSFSVGRGDMIFNLRQRVEAVCSDVGPSIAADVLLELFRRVDRADTVFCRLAEVHTNEKTRWTGS